MDRILKAYSPLGEDQLLFRAMHGTEGLSQLFEFEVELLSPRRSIDAGDVLGKALALEMRTAGGTRFLHGQIVRFVAVGPESRGSRHTVHRATVRPWLWFLTRSRDNKVFQNKSVVEILEEVFGGYGFAFEKKLSGSYRPWELCVQYEESDFDFVSRLMELEGIYYYFKHEKNKHTLVLADDIGAHEDIPGYASIDYFAADLDASDDLEVIDAWQATEEIRSGSYALDDFNFTTFKADLRTVRSQPRAHANADYEMYEWLGDYTDAAQAEHYARVRLEESQSLAARSSGHATVRGMAPGYRFSMRNSPRESDNREYLVVSVSYALREGGYATGAAPGAYSFGFTAQPTDNPFRAARRTPMPRTTGPQTATVVGPEGAEIWTDQYGRVKVQFRWDREGQRNENSSSWVRVSQAWAGDGFGTVHVPRVGQEVVVDFIAGRIDRPIVIGRVYNADQMPPFDLPGEATRSGIVSRSAPGGAVANANVLAFEDRTGAEQILLHAQRNLDVEVEGDETHTTQKTRTTLIKGHESATYESGEERHITNGAEETIDDGEARTVTGGAIETVKGGETRTIEDGATERISGGELRTVNGGINETVNGDVVVTINGTVLRLVSGADIRVTGSGRVEIVNAVDITLVQGPKLKTVLGPKIVYAPSMRNTSTDYVISTTTFKLNATGTVINTPEQHVNAADQSWWNQLTRESYWHQRLFVLASLDLFGNKIQTSIINSLLQPGMFVNLSVLNWVQAKKVTDVPWAKIAAGLASLRSGGKQKTTSGMEVES